MNLTSTASSSSPTKLKAAVDEGRQGDFHAGAPVQESLQMERPGPPRARLQQRSDGLSLASLEDLKSSASGPGRGRPALRLRHLQPLELYARALSPAAALRHRAPAPGPPISALHREPRGPNQIQS